MQHLITGAVFLSQNDITVWFMSCLSVHCYFHLSLLDPPTPVVEHSSCGGGVRLHRGVRGRTEANGGSQWGEACLYQRLPDLASGCGCRQCQPSEWSRCCGDFMYACM